MSAAERALDTIIGGNPGRRSLCANRMADGSPGFRLIGFHTESADLLDAAAEVNRLGADVWFGVHPVRDDIEDRKRGSAADVVSISVLLADLDWRDPTHKKDAPPEAEVRAMVDRLDIAPGVVIHTGHGLHAYWPLSGVVTPVDGRELQRLLDVKLVEVGLSNDRTDIASVLRVPGSTNFKGEPVSVVVEKSDDRRIDIDEMRSWLGSTGAVTGAIAAVGHWKPLDRDNLHPLDLRALEVLEERYGAHNAIEGGDGTVHVTRPRKLAGTSATIGFLAPGAVKVFSSNWPRLKHDQVYSLDELIAGETDHDAVIRMFGVEESPTNLGDDFYNARPAFQRIAQAAYSRARSRDAVLGAVLCRLSALTPPTVRLPAIVGDEATLDLIVATVGPPGSGKSTSRRIAGKLFPFSNPKVRTDVPVGSGEGLIDAYLSAPKKEERDGRTVMVREQALDALLVVVDEGQVLGELSKRSGSTLLPVLRSAWSGEALGQTNASAETNRYVAAGAYRAAVIVALQPDHAVTILEDDAGGTPQRFVWLSTIDAAIPDVAPEWPGELALPTMPMRGFRQEPMTVTDEIRREIRGRDLARQRGQVTESDPLEGHGDLIRLKLAGLLAILDSRRDVTEEDWSLAGQITTVSKAVRSSIVAHHRETVRDRADEANRAAANRAVLTQQALADDEITRGARTLAKRLHRNGEIETKGELRRALHSAQRHAIDDVIAFALDKGWIAADESDGFRAGESMPG